MDADRQQDDTSHARPPPAAVVRPAPAPASALRLSTRCVLLMYFDGDVGSSVDEHFSRSLKAAASTRQKDMQQHHVVAATLRQQQHQQLYRRAASSKYRADRLLCTPRSMHFSLRCNEAGIQRDRHRHRH